MLQQDLNVESLLAIVVKYGVLGNEWALLCQALLECQWTK